jgi:hypothetical protein
LGIYSKEEHVAALRLGRKLKSGLKIVIQAGRDWTVTMTVLPVKV